MPIPSEVQRAIISAAVLGDNTLVAAAGAAKAIRVVAAVFVASGGANTLRLESDAGGTALTGVMDLAADGQLVWPYNPAGWVQTADNELLNLELAAGTAVEGVLNYVTMETTV